MKFKQKLNRFILVVELLHFYVEEINLILSKIRNSFSVSIDAECTLECNPENVNSNIINDWKKSWNKQN